MAQSFVNDLASRSDGPTAEGGAGDAQRDVAEYYRALFLGSPLPVLVFDPAEAVVVDANDAALAQYGYSRGELIGRSLLDIRPEEEHERFREAHARVLRGEEVRGRYRHWRRDGSIVHVDVATHRVMLGGRALQLAILQDVTARVRAEESLHSLLRINQQLNSSLDPERLLEELIVQAVALVGAEGGCAGLRAGDSMVCEKYYQLGEFLPLRYAWERGEGLPGWLLENRLPYVTNDARRDPQIVQTLCDRFGVRSAISTPILDSAGEPLGFFEVHNKRDGLPFTEEDRDRLTAVAQAAAVAIQKALAHRELQRAEQRFREVAEVVRAVVWRAEGTPLRLVHVGQEVETILGYPREQWLRDPNFAARVVDTDGPFELFFEAVRRVGVDRPVEREVRCRAADGHSVWMRSIGRMIELGNGECAVVGVSIDVTELREVKVELDRSREQLRRLAASLQSVRERERRHIAREIHDELGQSITGLKMELSWLRRRLGRRDAELTAQVDDMLLTTDRTLDTVRRMATELRPGVLDDLGLLPALEWQGQQFVRRTAVPCRLEHPPSLPPVADEVATAVFRIFQESLTNVARHARAGEVRAYLGVHQDELVLEVHDDGVGFDVPTVREQGTLGILGMHERAAALGGSLAVRSACGQGTTVLLRLPPGHGAQRGEGR